VKLYKYRSQLSTYIVVWSTSLVLIHMKENGVHFTMRLLGTNVIGVCTALYIVNMRQGCRLVDCCYSREQIVTAWYVWFWCIRNINTYLYKELTFLITILKFSKVFRASNSTRHTKLVGASRSRDRRSLCHGAAGMICRRLSTLHTGTAGDSVTERRGWPVWRGQLRNNAGSDN